MKEQLAEKIASGGLSSLTPSQREAAEGLGLIKIPKSGGKRPPPLQRRSGGNSSGTTPTPRAPKGKMVFRNGRLVPANQ